MKRYPALLLLLALACTDKRAPRPIGIDSTPAVDSQPADTALPDSTVSGELPDTARPDTTALDSLLDSIADVPIPPVVVVDTIVKPVSVIDSTIPSKPHTSTRPESTIVVVVSPPPVGLGMPNGPFHLPPDSLCAPLGYNATFRFASSSGRYIVNDLKTARRCRGRLIVGISRGAFKTAGDTGLSVANGIAAIGKLPWAAMQPYIDDGTVLGFYAADDVSSAEWGGAPMATRMARWDSIYAELRRRAPAVARIIRAKPTELKSWGYKGTAITTGWAQGRGPYRDKETKAWVASQVAAAKSLKLGLVLGQNVLDGGCGPAVLADGKANTSCLPNIPGVPMLGTTKDAAKVRRYQTSAAELLYDKTIFLTEPYACASIDWQWSPIWTGSVSVGRTAQQIAEAQLFHTRADIKAAAVALGVVARTQRAASCIHPDRR